MKQKLTDENVMQMRELFWMKCRGEITLTEMQQRVDEIAGNQLKISSVDAMNCVPALEVLS